MVLFLRRGIKTLSRYVLFKIVDFTRIDTRPSYTRQYNSGHDGSAVVEVIL